MLRRHVSRQLAAHIDGKLAAIHMPRVELHLARCERCRTEREMVRFGMLSLDHLSSVQAPDGIWVSIEAALSQHRRRESPPLRWWRLAFASLVLVAVAGAMYWKVARRPQMQWEVVQIHGAPAIGTKLVHGAGRIGAGEWIETDSSSRAIVKVGAIGTVELTPNTRLLVETARPGENRLALARGEIRANISAPPRLFFVDTASGTAVDLGCEYSLKTDEEGSRRASGDPGLGVVSMDVAWSRWFRPAQVAGRIPQTGPGVPCFDDAPEEFKIALESFRHR